MSDYVIPSDALYPRDDAHRFRVYARKLDRLTVVAATDTDGLGRTLLELDNDQREHGERLTDLGNIGILDAVERRWLVSPWHRYDGSATVGA